MEDSVYLRELFVLRRSFGPSRHEDETRPRPTYLDLISSRQ